MTAELSIPALIGKNFLITGSMAEGADATLKTRARDYVKALANEVVRRGGNLVVYLAAEPLDADGECLTFDWLIAREVDRLFPDEQASARLIVVTSDRNRREKMNDAQRVLLAKLAARRVCVIENLRDSTVTGGNIGDAQVEYADAMFALAGGKGVTDRAYKLAKEGVPTLPMDIETGGICNDGLGALGLHRDFMNNPSSLMEHTGKQAVTELLGLSLQTPVQPLEKIAARSVELMHLELAEKQAAARTDVLLLTALPVELAAARMAFDIPENASPRTVRGTYNVWRSQKRTSDNGTVTVDVACFATAGNVNAAAITATLIAELGPAHVVMIGIAAGLREKCKLGQVVIAERVVAYEGKAVLNGGDEQARPEQYHITARVRQGLARYLSTPELLKDRLDAAWRQHEFQMPTNVTAGPVANSPLPEATTIAAGEELLRDEARLQQIRTLHGKIEVFEMEAVGVHAACQNEGVPAIVIRGISDFGDETKDGRFHDAASRAAAIVADDFIRNCLSVQ
ncbi:phosphorylase [Burkholderia gladioli]|uniref:5'-methylthioadenosine/S-adenosylhomocysteine nucleosidase family protein n=1 Tax=Burkholderia gladioli TaxID=28095 RepID=UPI00163F8B64|nr:phosphorylase [Burkholderia gladioli]